MVELLFFLFLICLQETERKKNDYGFSFLLQSFWIHLHSARLRACRSMFVQAGCYLHMKFDNLDPAQRLLVSSVIFESIVKRPERVMSVGMLE